MKLALLNVIATLVFAGTAHAQTLVGGGKNVSFPIHITQPGSYELAGNLSVPAGVAGIVIDVPDVTLDLNGYTIQGPNKCSLNPGGPGVLCNMADAKLYGIYAGYYGGAVVRNGTVRGFAGHGVYLGPRSRAEKLTVVENANSGLYVGAGSVASAIVSALNLGAGLGANQSLVSDVTASNNGGNGVKLYGAALLRGGSLFNNFLYAVSGDQQSGYRDVVMMSAGGAYSSGPVSLGNNLCDGTPC